MKALIIGSGAIGSLVGGILTGAGVDVTFLDLPQVVDALKKKGVKVYGLERDIGKDSVNALTTDEEPGEYDLAVVAVKSFCTKAAIKNIRDDVAKKILTFQNGIGNEEILAEKFGKNKIIAGSITYPVSYLEYGHVKIENPDAGIGLSPMDPAVDMDELADLFKKGGLNVVTADDYRSLKWSKLILNLVCNASCAILGMSPGEVFSDRRLVRIEREQILEALRVMDRKKIKRMDLPGYSVKQLTLVYRISPPSILKMLLKKRIAKGRGDKKPSLLLELERGSGRTEVKFLNGAVYQHAYQCAVRAPVNKILSETLEDITRKLISWEDYKGAPESFINLFE